MSAHINRTDIDTLARYLINESFVKTDDMPDELVIPHALDALRKLRAVADAAGEYIQHLPEKFMTFDENSLTPTGRAIRKLVAALKALREGAER